jgi:hypothetical protein
LRERDLQRLAVEEHAVFRLSMLAEALAVVRQEHDQGLVVDALFLQQREEAPDDGIGRRDLAVVGPLLVAALERLRRLVGSVRLVEVEKGKHGLAGGRLRQPRRELLFRLVPRPLDAADGQGALGRLHVVVVEVEAARDAADRFQDEAGHGPAGRVARFPQQLGQRGNLRTQAIADIVVDAVVGGHASRQDRRVRRERERGLRVRLLE